MGKLRRAWGALCRGYHWLWVLEASTRYCAMLIFMWTVIMAGALLGLGLNLWKGIETGDPRVGSSLWMALLVAFDLANLIFWVKKYSQERKRQAEYERRMRELMVFMTLMRRGWHG